MVPFALATMAPLLCRELDDVDERSQQHALDKVKRIGFHFVDNMRNIQRERI